MSPFTGLNCIKLALLGPITLMGLSLNVFSSEFSYKFSYLSRLIHMISVFPQLQLLSILAIFFLAASSLYDFFIFKLEFNLNYTMFNYKSLLRTSFIYLLTLISVMAFTQDRWQEGYIHTTKGDSLFSKIDVDILENAPEKCIYRIPKIREQHTLQADEICSVSLLSGRAFKTKTITLRPYGRTIRI